MFDITRATSPLLALFLLLLPFAGPEGVSAGFSVPFTSDGRASFFSTCCFSSGRCRLWKYRYQHSEVPSPNHTCRSHPSVPYFCKSSAFSPCLPRSTYSSGNVVLRPMLDACQFRSLSNAPMLNATRFTYPDPT